MIKINRYYPSKPFYEMTIEELQKFVKLQNYKDKKNNRKKKKRKTRRRYNNKKIVSHNKNSIEATVIQKGEDQSCSRLSTYFGSDSSVYFYLLGTHRDG